MTQQGIKQTTADRDALIAMLVVGDRHATAAFARADDMALLRRLAKQGDAPGALELVVERALMRGHGNLEIRRAAGLSVDALRAMTAAIYGRINA